MAGVVVAAVIATVRDQIGTGTSASSATAIEFAIAVIALLLAIGILSRGKETGPRACTRCYSIAQPKEFDPGNAVWSVFLFLLFIVPWIFYTIWR